MLEGSVWIDIVLIIIFVLLLAVFWRWNMEITKLTYDNKQVRWGWAMLSLFGLVAAILLIAAHGISLAGLVALIAIIAVVWLLSHMYFTQYMGRYHRWCVQNDITPPH